MIETVLITVAAIGSVLGSYEMPVAKPQMVVAEAAVATPTPTPTPTPEPVAEEPVEPETIETQEAPAEDFYSEPQEDLPPPADSYEEAGQTYIGAYTVTWYSREEFGYDAPGASGNGLVPGYSCALPDYAYLNHTVLVEGYGIYHVDDVSPSGICDLYVASNAEIPGYGMESANVYLLD